MSHSRHSMCLSVAACFLVYAGLLAGTGSLCASPSKDVCIPSPHEYAIGVIAHAAARSSIVVPVRFEEKQMVLVSEVISAKFNKNGPKIVEENWWVFDLYQAHRILSLFHALVSGPWMLFRPGLSDDQCKDLKEIVEVEVERRIQSLEDIRRQLPCTNTREWFERQCVRPGTFYSEEFCRRNLLSGCPREDIEIYNVFYKGWIYAFDLPRYIRDFSKLVSECCKDIWSDSAVVDGMAEVLCNHSFRAQKKWPSWTCSQGETGMDGLSQDIADVMCGPMTELYVNAVLRRVNLQSFWMFS